MRLIEYPLFIQKYRLLETVKLNPRRHTAPNALAHSEAVAALAVRLASGNGLTAAETDLLETLGWTHDIGKVKGPTSR
jgi:HD-GYP domain-containing protein (c-di-GMP phosphodiesterase class II)